MDAPAIDLLSTESFAAGHPWDQYRWLRENAPIYRHPETDGPGFWAVTRYDDVRAVSRQPGLFSSYLGGTMVPDADEVTLEASRQMMLNMDPPQHDRFKLLVSRGFTPRNAATLGPRVRALATEIVDDVIARGECDLVADIAGRLPSGLIAELMGISRSDGERLYELTEIMHTTDPAVAGPTEKFVAIVEMLQYAGTVAEEKRRNPGDDIASTLVQAEVDGDRLTEGELQWFFLLLVNAGGDTTRNLLSTGLLALKQNPDQLAWLMADLPGRLPSAREELLRYASPVIYMRRTATRDTQVGETKIAGGDKVVMYFGAANRDPAKFDAPDALDLARTPNEHIAFGGGPHVCLGQHLARIEIDAILEQVLTRMPDLEIVKEPEWLPSTFISGPTSMPVRFTPSRRT
jgi:cytochrome P450